MIHRRQEGVTDRLFFSRRVEQFQQRRQHRDARQERHQHADAGDLAEFGNAFVVGRQERQEAGGGRHGRQRQRDGRALGRSHQRRFEIVVLEPLGAIPHAVLDAEVHAQSDEQHGKRDRKQVQRTHHHQAGGGGDRKADKQRCENRENNLRRMQRHPENQQHHQHGADAVGDGAILDGCEFFIGGRHRPGKPHARAVFDRRGRDPWRPA